MLSAVGLLVPYQHQEHNIIRRGAGDTRPRRVVYLGAIFFSSLLFARGCALRSPPLNYIIHLADIVYNYRDAGVGAYSYSLGPPRAANRARLSSCPRRRAPNLLRGAGDGGFLYIYNNIILPVSVSLLYSLSLSSEAAGAARFWPRGAVLF